MTRSGRSLWTWTLSARPSPATSTDSPIDSRWSRIASTSSGLWPDGLEQEHRLVAEALVGVGDQGRWLGPGRCAGRRPVRTGALPDEVQQRALEQPIQPLPARVDDPGLAQDREQARRPRDRLLGAVQRRAQHGLDVVVPFRGGHGGRRRLADDRQDRAFDGLGDRAHRPSARLRTGRGPGPGR